MIEAEHIISNAIYGAFRQYAVDSTLDVDDTWLSPAISKHLALRCWRTYSDPAGR